jgi:hypothetical protein
MRVKFVINVYGVDIAVDAYGELDGYGGDDMTEVGSF